jgi:hypothetical protein
MSEPDGNLPIWTPAREPPPPSAPIGLLGRLLAILMLLVGVVLLLPGLLCIVIELRGPSSGGGNPITGLVFVLAIVGFGLLMFAISRLRRRGS